MSRAVRNLRPLQAAQFGARARPRARHLDGRRATLERLRRLAENEHRKVARDADGS